MKKIILLLLIAFGFLGCNDNQPITESAKLPPITQNGFQTIGCLVNGKALLPHSNDNYLFYLNPTELSYQEYGNKLRIELADLRGESSIYVEIEISGLPIKEGVTYPLDKNYHDDGNDFTGGEGTYENSTSYATNTTNIGELTITKLDSNERFISGTFWFDAVDSKGEKTEVREGRFDMRY